MEIRAGTVKPTRLSVYIRERILSLRRSGKNITEVRDELIRSDNVQVWRNEKNKNRKKDIIVYRIGLFSKDNVIMRESNVEVEVPAKKVQKFGLNVSPKKFNIKLSDAGEGFWFCKYAVKDDKKKNINKKKSFDSKGTLKKILGINWYNI